MQQILWGISSLSDALSGSRKVLLVCDSSYPFISIGPRVESAISGVGSPLLKFSDFASNPLEECVLKGVDLFTKEACDTLVAVGGGSSIDVAKCIKLYAKAPETKLIAIPTTAGTGSESTRFAVIYAQGKKQSITDDCIVPDFAILEPSVLESLPLYQKKCTMMGADDPVQLVRVSGLRGHSPFGRRGHGSGESGRTGDMHNANNCSSRL